MKNGLTLKLDTSKTGIDAIFKPYQIEAIKIVIDSKEIGSGALHKKINEHEGIKISRAMTIQFMNALVDQELAFFREVPGKGGYGKLYRIPFPLEEFNEIVVKMFCLKLSEAFPDIEWLKTIWEDK